MILNFKATREATYFLAEAIKKDGLNKNIRKAILFNGFGKDNLKIINELHKKDILEIQRF